MPIEEDISNLQRDVAALEELTLTLCLGLDDDRIARVMKSWPSKRVLAYLKLRTDDSQLCLSYGDSGTVQRYGTRDQHPQAARRFGALYSTRMPLPEGDPVRVLIETLNDLGAGISID